AIVVAIPTFNDRLQGKFKVRALAGWTMPPQQIWLRDKISSMADLKGKKVRTWNKTQVQMLDLLGGSGVAITPAEVIPALQRGVVAARSPAGFPASGWRSWTVATTGSFLNSLRHI